MEYWVPFAGFPRKRDARIRDEQIIDMDIVGPGASHSKCSPCVLDFDMGRCHWGAEMNDRLGSICSLLNGTCHQDVACCCSRCEYLPRTYSIPTVDLFGMS